MDSAVSYEIKTKNTLLQSEKPLNQNIKRIYSQICDLKKCHSKMGNGFR